MNRIDRISAILIQLQSRRVVKAQDIADRFEISLRTVYRDINTLYEAGIPIIGEAGVGYSLADGYKLPPVMFTAEEASTLLTAEKLVERLTDKKTYEVYQSALTKIRAILKNTEKDYLSELDSFIEVVDNQFFTKSIDHNQYLQDILRAIAQKTVIAIDYFANHSKEESQRTIEPIGIFFSTNRWYLLAFCYLRNDYRQFRLDRIKGVKFQNQRFSRKHPTLKAYLDNLPQRNQDLQKIVIRISQKIVSYLGEQKYYFGYVSEQLVGDDVELTFLTPSLEGFARWYISYGDYAEVVSPPHLCERVKQIAENVLKKI